MSDSELYINHGTKRLPDLRRVHSPQQSREHPSSTVYGMVESASTGTVSEEIGLGAGLINVGGDLADADERRVKVNPWERYNGAGASHSSLFELMIATDSSVAQISRPRACEMQIRNQRHGKSK
ncbi:hypothetical protein R3P38DRAFT_2760312 [Favolaschia claudopus]|uniref:Uncharacterized protein n=1 Tax=Favolaschia claudopus TaxID=2862362 RepID=A0AAW0E6K2_9AGAR